MSKLLKDIRVTKDRTVPAAKSSKKSASPATWKASTSAGSCPAKPTDSSFSSSLLLVSN
jgi:hypothetical protein